MPGYKFVEFVLSGDKLLRSVFYSPDRALNGHCSVENFAYSAKDERMKWDCEVLGALDRWT
jgi:hypothetical protein